MQHAPPTIKSESSSHLQRPPVEPVPIKRGEQCTRPNKRILRLFLKPRTLKAMAPAGGRRITKAMKASDVAPRRERWWKITLTAVPIVCFTSIFLIWPITGIDIGYPAKFSLFFVPYVFMMIDCFFYRYWDTFKILSRGKKREWCQLCQYKLQQDSTEGQQQHTSKEHREECANLNSHILESFPVLYPDVMCPKCQDPLRVWPVDHCAAFICPGFCPNDVAVYNTGSNLFRCFKCSYDQCLPCVNRHRDGKLRQERLRLERRDASIESTISLLKTRNLALRDEIGELYQWRNAQMAACNLPGYHHTTRVEEQDPPDYFDVHLPSDHEEEEQSLLMEDIDSMA